MKSIFLAFILVALHVVCFTQNSALAMIEDAVSLQKNDDPEASITLCNRILEMDSTFTSAYFLRGYNYYLLNDYEAAINDFSSAIRFNPEYLDAFYYRGKSKQASGDFVGALRDLNRSRELNPVQTTFLLARGLFSSIFRSSGSKER
jgi:tetratricopeptide (TPR) repeat protein